MNSKTAPGDKLITILSAIIFPGLLLAILYIEIFETKIIVTPEDRAIPIKVYPKKTIPIEGAHVAPLKPATPSTLLTHPTLDLAVLSEDEWKAIRDFCNAAYSNCGEYILDPCNVDEIYSVCDLA